MKPDLDYMAKLMHVFIDSDKAHVTIIDIEKSGIEIESDEGKLNECFLFHFQLMNDNGLISDKDSRTKVGLKSLGIHHYIGGATITDTPIRLTQDGHDFANVLSNRDVLNRLKNDFSGASFNDVYDIGKKLLSQYFKNKLEGAL